MSGRDEITVARMTDPKEPGPKKADGRQPVEGGDTGAAGGDAKAERLARQAEELRRNLQRRKAQQRERRDQSR